MMIIQIHNQDAEVKKITCKQKQKDTNTTKINDKYKEKLSY